jgi:hypothetical protein
MRAPQGKMTKNGSKGKIMTTRANGCGPASTQASYYLGGLVLFFNRIAYIFQNRQNIVQPRGLLPGYSNSFGGGVAADGGDARHISQFVFYIINAVVAGNVGYA